MIQQLHLQYTEAELINECVGGNSSAQECLYELLHPRMYAVCLRYVGDREVARDILHDGFILLFSKLKNYRGEGSFEGWARKLFVNTALMHLRKNDALKESEGIETLGFSSVSIDAKIPEQFDASILMDIISKMPVGFRTVFNMFAIEGFSHKEIAEQLRITEGGSRSQLSRARIWLQERLREIDNF